MLRVTAGATAAVGIAAKGALLLEEAITVDVAAAATDTPFSAVDASSA